MYKALCLLLLAFLAGCSEKEDEQNDPYVIENTNIDYEPPAPYYDSDSETE